VADVSDVNHYFSFIAHYNLPILFYWPSLKHLPSLSTENCDNIFLKNYKSKFSAERWPLKVDQLSTDSLFRRRAQEEEMHGDATDERQ
jgi:hypothetical protein